MRLFDQKRTDRGRKTYRLSFPTELSPKDTNNWMQSVAGALQVGALDLTAPPNIAFELWADASGMTHRMRVPWDYAGDVSAQLYTLVPGISIVEETDFPEHNWTVAYEYKETAPQRTLRIPSPEVMAAEIHGSVNHLQDGEAMLVQWVITAARVEKQPVEETAIRPPHWAFALFVGSTKASREEVADRRAKLQEANLQAVLRVAARAETESRAGYLAGRIHSRLRGIDNGYNKLKRRRVKQETVTARISRAAGMVLWPIKLSTSEFISLMGWPIGSPHVAGYASGLPRQLAPTAGIPSAGTVIGHANFSGAERRLAVSDKPGSRHIYVCGKSGMGKTALLTNIAVQRMQAGEGLFVIESKGDLFYEVLERIPPERVQDVCVIDVDDTDRPVGFNILAQGSTRRAVDQLSNVITSIYKGDMGVYTPMVLYHGLHALAQVPGHTFVDLPTLLMPQTPEEHHWRESLVDKIPDKSIRQFWQRYLNGNRKEQDRMSAPVHNRIWQLVTRPEVRNIFGQAQGTFSIADAIKERKIVLIFLNDMRVGEDTAAVAGTLFFNELWTRIRTIKPENRTSLIMDEFQEFMGRGIDTEQTLAQARSFNLDLVLAHQNIDQLNRQLNRGILANAASKILFRVSSEDAKVFAREFGKRVADIDLMNQEQFGIVAQLLMDNGNASSPVTAKTIAPPPRTGVSAHVRELSRQKYGKPVEQVEAEMEARRTVTTEPKRRSSGTKWG